MAANRSIDRRLCGCATPTAKPMISPASQTAIAPLGSTRLTGSRFVYVYGLANWRAGSCVKNDPRSGSLKRAPAYCRPDPESV